MITIYCIIIVFFGYIAFLLRKDDLYFAGVVKCYTVYFGCMYLIGSLFDKVMNYFPSTPSYQSIIALFIILFCCGMVYIKCIDRFIIKCKEDGSFYRFNKWYGYKNPLGINMEDLVWTKYEKDGTPIDELLLFETEDRDGNLEYHTGSFSGTPTR